MFYMSIFCKLLFTLSFFFHVIFLWLHWEFSDMLFWVLLSLSNLLFDPCDESLWSSMVLLLFGVFRIEGMKMYIRKMRNECGIHLGHLAELKCQPGTAGSIISNKVQKIKNLFQTTWWVSNVGVSEYAVFP